MGVGTLPYTRCHRRRPHACPHAPTLPPQEPPQTGHLSPSCRVQPRPHSDRSFLFSLWHSESLNAVLLPLWSVSLPGIPAPQGPGTREAPCTRLGSSSCVLHSRSGPCSVWDVHMGIPWEPHKTRKGCFIVPISRRWKLRLRKGGSTAQAHPLKVTLQRNDRAEVQIQLPLMSKTPSQVAALLLLDRSLAKYKE